MLIKLFSLGVTAEALRTSINQLIDQSVNRSIDLYCITEKNYSNTMGIQAKLDKLVTSLSQLLINYYKVSVENRRFRSNGGRLALNFR